MEGPRRSGRRGGEHPNRYDKMVAAIVAAATKRKPSKNSKKPSKSYHRGTEAVVRPVAAPSAPKIDPDTALRDLAKSCLPTYTIGWAITLNGNEILTSGTTSKSFRYQEIHAEGMAVAKQRVESGLVLVSGVATIKAAGSAKLSMPCTEAAHWDKVAEVVRVWLEEKRKQLNVNLVHDYTGEVVVTKPYDSSVEETSPPKKKSKHKRRRYTPSSSTTILLSSSFDSDSKRKKRKEKKKMKKRAVSSTTLKQEARARERRQINQELGYRGHEIMKRWACDYTRCQNRTHHCWQPEGKTQLHYRLASEHIKRWNAAISRGDNPNVSVSEPP